MPPAIRNLFPLIAIGALAAAIGWAVSFGTLPKADFTFTNGDQIKTMDPAIATGQPEGRIINGLFEGLLRSVPPEGADDPANRGKNVPMVIRPGVAELPEISEDGKTYVFKIRKGAKWSNGRQMTAHDFVFSWQRMLHPETTSEYAYQLHYIVGAEAYNLRLLNEQDDVEVELLDRPELAQPFPRGTVIGGKLIEIHKPPELVLPKEISKDEKENQEAAWKKAFVYTVQVTWKCKTGGKVQKITPEERHFAQDVAAAQKHFDAGELEPCRIVLTDFDKTVAINAKDDFTLELQLKSPTPYFQDLVAFYPLYPVCRECVEEHGTPEWTKVGKIVSNGPFTLHTYRLRDRIRMVKSQTYWNRDKVKLNSVDALAVKQDTTALNMYMTGQVDWITTVPNTILPELKQRDDFHSTPMLTVYFYRINVDRQPLDNVIVRRALNAAIDKQEICDKVAKAGQVPARSYVPPGLPGYEAALCGEFNLDEARRLLAEAGYPNGDGLGRVEILFNTNEDHRMIAEVIQQQWNKLGIKCELRNLEWGSFLPTLSNTQYSVARSGWIGDYPDANTFLDMFVSNGPNNQTNWKNTQYDQLIEKAKQASGEERLKILHDAERILMDELPIIPIYFQVSKNMVNPRVRGFSSNIQDIHPLEMLSVEDRP
jgi:oligopeptide transport system substrate-binding protein